MSERVWQLVDGFDPLIHVWDSESVIYDRFSGNTHLLDVLSLRLVEMLANDGMSENRLISTMADELVVEVDDEFFSYIQMRLDALLKLNIAQSPNV